MALCLGQEQERVNVAVTQDNILLTDDNKPSNCEFGINGITLFAKVCTLCYKICVHIKTSNICNKKLFNFMFVMFKEKI